MPDMAEKLGVGTGVRELKIGQSFFNQNKSSAHRSKSGNSRNITPNSFNGDQENTEKSFHSIRYDFKPASSNTSSTGFLDVDEDNRVSVKIQHEGSGQTNFSGHQKEANAKDCLLIIDHVTGEITLEKLSSQIMVKKTRSEKPDSKLETPIVLPTQSSRPQTPNNVAKHDSSKSSQNKKVTDHKTGRVNHVNPTSSSKSAASSTDHTASKIKMKGGDNLSSASSSDSSSDSDSDSDSPNHVGKPPETSTRPTQLGYSTKTKHNTTSMSGATSGVDKTSYKHSNQSSPRPRVHSPKQPIVENKPMKPIQSKSSPAPVRPELNDEFDDSDDSDNEMSNTKKDTGQDYSLGRFTPSRTSQTGRSVPNFSNFDSDYSNASESKKSEIKSSSKAKPGPGIHSSSSNVPSMPQFLNDDLELSESDSDS